MIGFPIYVNNPNVNIGNCVHLYPNVGFYGKGTIVVQDNVKIGANCIIHATEGSYVKIEKNTIIAANTYIIDCNHNTKIGIPIQNQEVTSSPVIIESDVWIGASCVVGMGVTIKQGAVIGANSYVNKNIHKNSIAVGTPAKVIKKRI